MMAKMTDDALLKHLQSNEDDAAQYVGQVGEQRLASMRVHCRIGSSEIADALAEQLLHVHCRIGSSEIQEPQSQALRDVHCRIGSSEN